MNQAEQAALLKLKLQRVIALNQHLQDALEKEQKKSAQLQKDLEECRKSEDIAEERNKISKLAVGIRLSSIDEKEVKQNLQLYIKQIDECLKLLNQMSDNT